MKTTLDFAINNNFLFPFIVRRHMWAVRMLAVVDTLMKLFFMFRDRKNTEIIQAGHASAAAYDEEESVAWAVA